jgi:hypothetical protein
MTKPQSPKLDELLRGMQLSFFEIIWPVFQWMESIWVRENNGKFDLFVETKTTPDEKEWADVDYLVREVLTGGERVLDELAPGSKHKIEYEIQRGPAVPKDRGYRELMSEKVFKTIARKHAPWRLESGR